MLIASAGPDCRAQKKRNGESSIVSVDSRQISSVESERCVDTAVGMEGRGDEVEIELGGEVLLLAGMALALVVT
jgi:hypothetical protein